MNIVILKGNLSRDIEMRYTASNTAVANTAIAINETYKKADGTKQETVSFIDLEMWGSIAETMSKYLGKGRAVLIHGKLKQEVWDDKQSGQKRSKLKVTVVSFEFCDSKRDGDSQPSAGHKGQRHESSGQHEPLDDDDVPF